MLKKILLTLVSFVAVAVVVVMGLAMKKPDEMTITRTGTTAATPATVYALLNDFHRFHEWSPWEKLDPNMKVDYSGPVAGVGTSYHWVGNDKAGEGRMTIVGVEPDAKVDMKLEFMKPFANTCTATFALAPKGSGTEVTWVMNGHNNTIAKVMSVLIDMDKAVGKDFEDGLGNLARVAEATPAATPADSTAQATTPS